MSLWFAKPAEVFHEACPLGALLRPATAAGINDSSVQPELVEAAKRYGRYDRATGELPDLPGRND